MFQIRPKGNSTGFRRSGRIDPGSTSFSQRKVKFRSRFDRLLHGSGDKQMIRGWHWISLVSSMKAEWGRCSPPAAWIFLLPGKATNQNRKHLMSGNFYWRCDELHQDPKSFRVHDLRQLLIEKTQPDWNVSIGFVSKNISEVASDLRSVKRDKVVVIRSDNPVQNPTAFRVADMIVALTNVDPEYAVKLETNENSLWGVRILNGRISLLAYSVPPDGCTSHKIDYQIPPNLARNPLTPKSGTRSWNCWI